MPTAAEILDLDVLQRTEHFEFTLLDRSLAEIEIDSPDGKLHPSRDSTPSITCDGSRHVTRTLEGLTLTPRDSGLVDPIGHRLRVDHVLPEASDQTHWPLGIFMFTETPRRVSTSGRHMNLTLQDQSLILDQKRRYATSIDALGVPALASAVVLAVFTGIPYERIIYDDDPTAPGAPVAWRPGENTLKILRDMASLGHPMWVYFDNAGFLRFRKIPDDVDSLVPDHVYTASDSARLRVLGDGYDETDDLWQAPNIYAVQGTDATEASISGVYRLPAAAPHSIENLGFERPEVIEAQGATTSADLSLQALQAYLHDNRAMKYVTFLSPPDPRHDTYGIVEFMGANHFEMSWSLPLHHGARMEHRIARVYLGDEPL